MKRVLQLWSFNTKVLYNILNNILYLIIITQVNTNLFNILSII